MTGPDAPGGADDAPTVPGLTPVRPDRPELGIPGLDYMPAPAGGPPPVGGVHRRERRRPPWSWLTAAAALAVLGALTLTWMLSGTTDGSGSRRPQATAPVTDPLASPLPTDFPSSTSSPPTPSPTVTMSPSASASPSPTPSPRPQPVRVPDVIGDRQASAEAKLRAAGFAVAVAVVPAPSPRQARRVISQRPGPDQLARPGSVVSLVVGDR